MLKQFFLLLGLCCNLSGVLYTQCANGNFETGTTANWEGYYGFNLRGSTDVLRLTKGFKPGYQDIVDASITDAYSGFPRIVEGNYALRLGTNIAAKHNQVVSYTFMVTAAYPLGYVDLPIIP